MEMTGLKRLSASMSEAGVDIQHFIYNAGVAQFYCIYTEREIPNLLTLTSRGRNPFFHKLEVHDFKIAIFLGDKYKELQRLLFGDAQSGRKLEPSEFFSQLNRAIPRQATAGAVPSNAEILTSRPDMEERDKPFFLKYQTRGRGPTPKNKAKTAALIGKDALAFSIQTNQSSIWSDKDPAQPPNRRP